MTFVQRFRRLFVPCALPVHLWAVLVYFYDLPGLMLRMSPADFLAHGAYVLAFALFESAALALFFTLFSLPFSSARLPALEVILLVCGAWLLIGRALPLVGQFLSGRLPPEMVLPAFKAMLVLLPVGLLASLLGIRGFFRRRVDASARAAALHERLSILMGAYLFVDMLSVGYILLRNF
ncbi:MAG: hypothetical protein Fur0018_12830 [Anaerolineales bacterium]